MLNKTADINEPRYPIRIAAKTLGISIHTLRMYEREGLIIPYKRETNQRLYSQSDLDRITCLRDAINKEKISINGIKTILSLIPCWEIKKCSENDRANCSAFNSHSVPCWLAGHENTSCSQLNCRDCVVYTSCSDCNKIKSIIRNILENKPMDYGI
ncbi:MAG: MerR family transcriptional regulator [Bacteroidota bacterium]|nr:MerR family transcriptional regulator [Bacteroidota bacterium]